MSEEEFTQLFKEFHPLIRSYLLRRSDHTTAEDVCAETFTTVWQSFAKAPEDPSHRRAWIYTIARNHLAHAQRSRLRQLRLTVQLKAAVLSGVPVAEPDVADLALRSDEALRAYRRLPARDQEVLQLIAWDGLSIPEAATVLGCSLTALTTRLMRIRRRLGAAAQDELDMQGDQT